MAATEKAVVAAGWAEAEGVAVGQAEGAAEVGQAEVVSAAVAVLTGA